jgi:hypothetical protein
MVTWIMQHNIMMMVPMIASSNNAGAGDDDINAVPSRGLVCLWNLLSWAMSMYCLIMYCLPW